MRVGLVTGGVRSGKSAFALETALRLGQDEVSYIATAQAGDAEMADRIRRHRDERPAVWQTVESPRDVGAGMTEARHGVVVLDCLTVLLSNRILALENADQGAVEGVAQDVASEIIEATSQRRGHLIMVTNEVGMGVVPASPLGRWFRDAQGALNQRIAAVADWVVLAVSGIPVPVKGTVDDNRRPS